jgi:hypothetical protein
MKSYLIALVLLVGAFWYLRSHGSFSKTKEAPEAPPSSASPAPAPPAGLTLGDAAREADSGGGGVTENMTADQVRRLLGPPDEVESGMTDSGQPRERWIYRRQHRAVVFVNGVAARVEPN